MLGQIYCAISLKSQMDSGEYLEKYEASEML